MTEGNILVPKSSKKFYCKYCDYNTSRESQWERHISTAKHKRMTQDDKKDDTSIEKSSAAYICDCGKSYKHRQGLSKHKKICKKVPKYNEEKNVTSNPVIDDEKKELMEIIKKQQQQINELIPCVGNNNNNNTTNNFNVNFFLNNDCKDAMNITDFIESLQVQLKELEYTADNGHVKGITNIFHTALANMEENKRPMHCTDLKREVLYIKDNNEWHKDEDKDILKNAVTKVVDKNCENQVEWLDNHPDVLVPGSKDSNKYIKMMDACLGKGDDTEQHKIMKNIMKNVKLETK